MWLGVWFAQLQLPGGCLLWARGGEWSGRAARTSGWGVLVMQPGTASVSCGECAFQLKASRTRQDCMRGVVGRGRGVCEQAGAACGSNSCAGIDTGGGVRGGWPCTCRVGVCSVKAFVLDYRVLQQAPVVSIVLSAPQLRCGFTRVCLSPCLLPCCLQSVCPPVYIHSVSLCTLAARHFAAGRVWASGYCVLCCVVLCCTFLVSTRRQLVLLPAPGSCVASSILFQQACVLHTNPCARRISAWCD